MARSFSSPWALAGGPSNAEYATLPRTDTLDVAEPDEVNVAALSSSTGRGLWYKIEESWPVANQGVATFSDMVVSNGPRTRFASSLAGEYRYSAAGRTVFVHGVITWSTGTLVSGDELTLTLPSLPDPEFLTGETSMRLPVKVFMHSTPTSLKGLGVPELTLGSGGGVQLQWYVIENAGAFSGATRFEVTEQNVSSTQRTIFLNFEYQRAQPA